MSTLSPYIIKKELNSHLDFGRSNVKIAIMSKVFKMCPEQVAPPPPSENLSKTGLTWVSG